MPHVLVEADTFELQAGLKEPELVKLTAHVLDLAEQERDGVRVVIFSAPENSQDANLLTPLTG